MSFLETVRRARSHLEEQDRVSLRALKREFALEDDALDELVEELVDVALREGQVLVWVGPARSEPLDGSGEPTTARALQAFVGAPNFARCSQNLALASAVNFSRAPLRRASHPRPRRSLPGSDERRSDLYRDLLPRLNNATLELLDHPRCTNQIVSLEPAFPGIVVVSSGRADAGVPAATSRAAQ